MGRDDRTATSAILIVAVVFSLGSHAIAWMGLSLLPAIESFLERPAPQTVEIVAITEPVPEPEPVVPEPEPEIEEPEPVAPEPEPEPVVRREPTPRVTEPEPTPEPPTPEPPAVEETIADFTGETLTNDDGPGWESAVGNGEAIEGPIGRPGAAVTGRNRQGNSAGVVDGTGTSAPVGPRVVAMADLSRQPSPRRDMNAILQRNYPPRARQLGIEGRAVISFRIMPDGGVSRLRTRTESPPEQGFAEACRRTVQQAEWEPPLARDGSAVATDASFECEFAIGL